MPYVITKGVRSETPYLGFDNSGTHEWKGDRLDAIRFDSDADARDCSFNYIKTGAKINRADEWDGHYERYGDYEIQVYKDSRRDIPSGKRWRFRIGPIVDGRAYEHSPSNMGYTNHLNALKAAKAAVDKKG